MTEAKVLQTLIVRFMSDGSTKVKLSGCDGITAKKLEGVTTLAFNELSKMRAVERHKGTSECEQRRLADLEAMKTKEEVK